MRTVSLKGELIEGSGVMSGGGRPKQGLMGSKIAEEFSEDQIKDITDKIKEAESRL